MSIKGVCFDKLAYTAAENHTQITWTAQLPMLRETTLQGRNGSSTRVGVLTAPEIELCCKELSERLAKQVKTLASLWKPPHKMNHITTRRMLNNAIQRIWRSDPLSSCFPHVLLLSLQLILSPATLASFCFQVWQASSCFGTWALAVPSPKHSSPRHLPGSLPRLLQVFAQIHFLSVAYPGHPI